jgi:hypothetical protein
MIYLTTLYYAKHLKNYYSADKLSILIIGCCISIMSVKSNRMKKTIKYACPIVHYKYHLWHEIFRNLKKEIYRDINVLAAHECFGYIGLRLSRTK